jgi:hypothetical protein
VDGVRVDVSAWPAPTPIAILFTTPNPPTAGLSPTEKLTAIQHANCTDYWILTVVQPIPRGQQDVGDGLGSVRVLLVTASGVQFIGDTPTNVNIHDVGYLKASPDGKRLALGNWQEKNVLLFNFDNTTGAVYGLQTINAITATSYPALYATFTYGVEFSPDSQMLYYTVLGGNSVLTGPAGQGYVIQVELSTLNQLAVAMHPNNDGTLYALGALQLGIDGRIYAAMPGEQSLGVIANPNVLGLGCCNQPFTSSALMINAATCKLGLPNLLPNPCETCATVLAEVNDYLSKSCAARHNVLAPCKENGEGKPCPCGPSPDGTAGEPCTEAEFPPIEPCITVSWGDSSCDCIETDDCEIFCITVCNCYSNVTFSGFQIASVIVTTATGATVPTLPDGSLSVEAIPRGPICLGDIGPCTDNKSTCVSRQFVLLTRGAKSGGYQLKITGLCFDVVYHYQQEACFQLELCADR